VIPLKHDSSRSRQFTIRRVQDRIPSILILSRDFSGIKCHWQWQWIPVKWSIFNEP